MPPKLVRVFEYKLCIVDSSFSYEYITKLFLSKASVSLTEKYTLWYIYD